MKIANIKAFLLKGIAIPVLIIGATFIVMILGVAVLNADLYERLTETENLGQPFASKVSQDNLPALRLVIHRLLPDENAVEASLIATVTGSYLDSLKKMEKTKLTCTIHDASTFQPFALSTAVVIEPKLGQPRLSEISIESERFRLPALPSVNGFPFDDVHVEAIMDVFDTDGYELPHTIEVQKALPGRILQASLQSGRVSIVLARSWIAKALVLASSVIFIVVCLLVAGHLFSSKTSLRGIEEILAIAGFLVAVGGFRSVLNFPATAGTTALELAVIGLPLVAVALGFAASTFRGIRDRYSAPPSG